MCADAPDPLLSLARLLRLLLEGAPLEQMYAQTRQLSADAALGYLAEPLARAVCAPHDPLPPAADPLTQEWCALVSAAAETRQRARGAAPVIAGTSRGHVPGEQELRTTSGRFRQALRAAKAGDWEWSLDGRTYWSDETFALLGLEPGQVVPSVEAWFERIHPDDLPRVRHAMEEGLRQRAEVDLETRVLLPDGTPRWLRHVGQPSFDTDGKLTHIYGVLIDITRGKESELAHEEAQARLQQAQRMEALGRLAGAVAHDFNNLLTIILSASHLVRETLPPESPHSEHVDAIETASNRGAALTRQLLALSRQQPIEPRPVALDAHVRRMAPMLQRLLGEEVVVHLDLRASAARIRIDPAQLDQILLNLAVNARDAMPRGGSLTFRTASDAQTPASVLLTVTDTGSGMDESARKQAFEPFFTTKPAGSGTGLGLATVYGILLQNGGQIEVQSVPGAGAEFQIRLPETTSEEAEPPSPPRYTSGRQSGLILVAEDEPAVRSLVRRVLAAAGYVVLDAANGADALELARAQNGKLDLLLTDVVLPTLSGPELAEQLREDDPELPVLFTSGYLGDVLATRGLPPESAFLSKPFTPAALLAAIERASPRLGHPTS